MIVPTTVSSSSVSHSSALTTNPGEMPPRRRALPSPKRSVAVDELGRKEQGSPRDPEPQIDADPRVKRVDVVLGAHHVGKARLRVIVERVRVDDLDKAAARARDEVRNTTRGATPRMVGNSVTPSGAI